MCLIFNESTLSLLRLHSSTVAVFVSCLVQNKGKLETRRSFSLTGIVQKEQCKSICINFRRLQINYFY